MEELPPSDKELYRLDTGDESMWKSLTPKQKKAMFARKLKEKNTGVSILQISEFLSEFLKGTKALHHQAF